MLQTLLSKFRKSNSAVARGTKSLPSDNSKASKFEREYTANNCAYNTEKLYGAKDTATKGGVMINGIEWATCNIGGSQSSDYGNYYTLEETQRACPAGWRLPALEEIEKLMQAPNKWTKINGVKGRIFGTPPNTIFLPAAGHFNYPVYGKKLLYGGECGYYRFRSPSGCANEFFINSNKVQVSHGLNLSGYSVRCVAE